METWMVKSYSADSAGRTNAETFNGHVEELKHFHGPLSRDAQRFLHKLLVTKLYYGLVS
jgi:hypothetical protein